MNNQKKLVIRPSFRTITLILSEHQSDIFSNIARQRHLCDSIILIGKGTLHSHALNILGLKSQKRIVVNILAEEEKAAEILDCVTEKLKLHEHGQGIAYMASASVAAYIDVDQQEVWNNAQDTEDKSMFKKLTVIVDRGMADDVMDIVRRAGVKGGTILHGRGTGSECAAKLFGIEIESEKELIIIIIPNDLTENVVKDLFRELRLDIPGNGILFLEPVSDVRGLFENSDYAGENDKNKDPKR